MRIKIFFHNNCFDGVASAATFAVFYRECINSDAEQSFEGLAHKAGQIFDESRFDGDENAIVDFKYSSSPQLTWWFDHHQSAFLTDSDEAHYRNDPAGIKSGKKFVDTNYRSCTKFIAETASSKFGLKSDFLYELVQWADVIDGALYPDAKTAVELDAPALHLMLVIESARDDKLLAKIIQDLQTMTLSQVASQDYITGIFDYYYKRHLNAIGIIKAAAHSERSAVYFDVSEHDMEGYSKFIPYYLHPEALYSIGLSLSPQRSKVSVGYNPWAKDTRRHNLASICERYGGGGHPVVGAISFSPQDLDLARKVALEIAEELRSS
ncbi:MAG: phosphoesterase [Acidobacteria bacterium]|nr:phosphoesterase [Acidobacteriota bacterium]